MCKHSHLCITANPSVSNSLFLYPMKTSENRKVSDFFKGLENGCIGNEWVKKLIPCQFSHLIRGKQWNNGVMGTKWVNQDNFTHIKGSRKYLSDYCGCYSSAVPIEERYFQLKSNDSPKLFISIGSVRNCK